MDALGAFVRVFAPINQMMVHLILNCSPTVSKTPPPQSSTCLFHFSIHQISG